MLYEFKANFIQKFEIFMEYGTVNDLIIVRTNVNVNEIHKKKSFWSDFISTGGDPLTCANHKKSFHVFDVFPI